MRTTDLHDVRDDVPRLWGGVRLKENGESSYLCDDDLTQVFRENEGQIPIASKIRLGLKGFKPGIFYPLYWIDVRTFDWRLKRKMKKLRADFVFIQFGTFYDCYDFYRLGVPPSSRGLEVAHLYH